MKIINLDKNTKIKKSDLPLIIGYFGCIHIMHNELLNMYHEFNVLTFKDTVFKKDSQIYDYKERINNLSHFNIEHCYVYDIDKGNLTAEQFIFKYLKPINPSLILVGSDFKFGSDQKGVNELKKYFNVNVIAYHAEVSTTLIKKWIRNNDLDTANDYLLTPYYYVGQWVPGRKKGREMGFRTVNVKVDKPLAINPGSYVVYITIGSKKYKGVAFYGASETFNVKKAMIEVNILNKKILPRIAFPPFIRNHIKVEFLKFIRCDRKFVHVFDLKEQISKDIDAANKFFKNNL